VDNTGGGAWGGKRGCMENNLVSVTAEENRVGAGFVAKRPTKLERTNRGPECFQREARRVGKLTASDWGGGKDKDETGGAARQRVGDCENLSTTMGETTRGKEGGR